MRHLSTPYTPQQNGIVEGENSAIMNLEGLWKKEIECLLSFKVRYYGVPHQILRSWENLTMLSKDKGAQHSQWYS